MLAGASHSMIERKHRQFEGNSVLKSLSRTLGSLPSTTAKFLKPIASNLCLTISDNSGICKTMVFGEVWGKVTKMVVCSLILVTLSYLLLQLLDVCCNVDQLFGGEGGGTPTLTATFVH